MCGVIGVWSKTNHAPTIVRQGLAALQHRGQESAGISLTKSGGKITTYTKMGLVPHVLTEPVLKKLGKSDCAIGHNRYATSGHSSLNNAQPITIKHGRYQLSIGHNGNIPDLRAIKKSLKRKIQTTSDTRLVAELFLQERTISDSWEEAFRNVLPLCHGAYSFVVLTNDQTLFAIRDPYGIRPLCLGKLHNGWIVSSESVALDAVGAEFVRDIAPGEIITIHKNGTLISSFFGEIKHPQYCLFEYVYFARPDSFINGRRVRTGRQESGKLLGERIKKKNIHADAVIPIFESGYPAAKGVAQALSLPVVDAITTSNYVGRTFIQPGQENRAKAVNGKHNIVPDEIVGKKVIVVDDSAVRLTTSKALIYALKDAGAKEVYFAVASPPVVAQCDLGIDMRSKKDLPASTYAKKSIDFIEQKMGELISADGMIYLPIEETTQAFGGTPKDFYHTPFGGSHPIRGKQIVLPRLKKPITGKPKIGIFLSGKGTFVQDLIDGIQTGDIDAEIAGVLANKKDAYGITRAKKYQIPTQVILFEGKRSDKQARKRYEEKLITYIKELKPDLLLLSGWLFILGDTFLQELQKLHIPVINHHPALLTSSADSNIATSRGIIPTLRGESVWEETFEKKLPVSGISVHQVLPGNSVDIGPVVMKSEVRIKPDESFDIWKKKMDETEHQLFPTALKRILHVLQNGIDISKGDFQW